MQYILLPMLVGALLGGGMALAQSSGEQPAKQARFIARFGEQFKAADKDGDGALTRAEAQEAKLSVIVENFDRLDADKDGKVTRKEIRALLRARLSI